MGSGFENTAELKPMKYNQAINGSDGEAWNVEIDNEHGRMVKNKVFEMMQQDDLSAGTEPIIVHGHTRRGAMEA